jgi:hypothetical protein
MKRRLLGQMMAATFCLNVINPYLGERLGISLGN